MGGVAEGAENFIKNREKVVARERAKYLTNKAIDLLARRPVNPAQGWEKLMPVVDGVIVVHMSCRECKCTFGPIKLDGSFFGCPICRAPWFQLSDLDENVNMKRVRNRGKPKGRKRHGRTRKPKEDGGGVQPASADRDATPVLGSSD